MNVFEAVAKLILDSKGYNEGLDDAQKHTEGFGSKVGSLLSGVGKAVGAAATAAVSAAAGGVVAITKQAVDAYSNYEQLAGGVETLFGDSAQTVLDNADKAFQNAGMSVNEYMETAIQSAASLINSLDGDQAKAAALMNTSITDMSDNVNKMGTTMEAVQNAYRGFSRGNFTMLDNLALGFAGTKEGMEELLQKAEKLSGVKYDINSYADIVEANHVVQTEMGISGLTAEEAAEAVKNGTMTQEEAYNALGTTAKEANGTIQGSMNQLKAAWSNLITNLGNQDVDLDKLVNNVVTAGKTVINNLKPVIERAVKGIGNVVQQIAPVIKEVLPPLVDELAPSVIEVVSSLATVIIKSLPQIVSALVQQIPGIISTLITAVGESLPDIYSALSEFVDTIFEQIGIKDKIDEFTSLVGTPLLEAFEQIREGISNAFTRISEVVSPVFEAIKEKFGSYISDGQAMQDITNFIADAANILASAISGLADFIATAVEKVSEFVSWLTSGKDSAEAFKTIVIMLTTAVTAYKAVVLATTIAQNAQKIGMIALEGVQKAVTVAQGLLNAVMSANPIGLIVAAIAALVAAFIYLWNTNEDFRNFWIGAWDSIKSAFETAWNGIKKFFEEDIPNTFNKLIDWFSDLPSKALDLGKNIVSGLWNGISNAWQWLKSKVEDLTEGLVGGLKSLLGINSPSKVFASIGDNLALGLGEGYEDAMVQVARDMQKISEDAIPTIEAPSINQGYGTNGVYGGMRDIVINIDGSGLSVDEIASELGSAVRREMRIAGAIG